MTSKPNISATKTDTAAFAFVIPSDYGRMKEIQDAVMGAVEARGYDADSVFAIKLSLEEALINAIKHGNKLDAKKHVHVQASISPKRTDIKIRDEGPGFERCDVPDPTAEENLEKCSGRGLLLIEAYMSDVAYSNGGCQLNMSRVNGQ